MAATSSIMAASCRHDDDLCRRQASASRPPAGPFHPQRRDIAKWRKTVGRPSRPAATMSTTGRPAFHGGRHRFRTTVPRPVRDRTGEFRKGVENAGFRVVAPARRRAQAAIGRARGAGHGRAGRPTAPRGERAAGRLGDAQDFAGGGRRGAPPYRRPASRTSGNPTPCPTNWASPSDPRPCARAWRPSPVPTISWRLR